jgi:hypothetical protein
LDQAEGGAGLHPNEASRYMISLICLAANKFAGSDITVSEDNSYSGRNIVEEYYV